MNDLKFALRALAKSPGFALVSILTVALGLGAATAIFSVAQAVVFRPLPFKDEGRLAWIWSTRPDRDRAFFSIPDFLDLKRDNRTTTDLAAITPLGFNLTGLGEPERVLGWRVTPNLFALLGVEAQLGRLPQPADDVARAAPTAVLGFGYWQRRFGGDPGVIGRTVMLNGVPQVIVGILPASFFIPNWDTDIVVSQSLEADARRGERGTNFLRAIARLKPGVTLAQAQAEFAGLNRQLARQYPETNGTVTAPRFVPLREETVGNYRAPLLLLLGAAGALLLIMSANLAGLMVARGLARQRDAALCSALGASPARLLRCYLLEGLLIAGAGGALGVAACALGLDALLTLAPADLPRAGQAAIDWRVLVVATGGTLLTGLGIGLAPALRLARMAPQDALKSGFGGGSKRAGARSGLVAVQVTLCTVLLIGTGLLGRSLQKLMEAQPGFVSTGVLTAQVSLPANNYQSVPVVTAFVDEFIRRLGALPGITAASMTSVLPLTGINTRSEFIRPDRPPANPAETLSAANRFVAQNYFATLGIPLMAGRDFRTGDDALGRPVVIIDQTLAQQHWPGEDPLGKSIRIRDGTSAAPRDLEIIGVVGPTKNFTLEEKGTPTLYLPFRQMVAGNLSFFVGRAIFVARTAGDPLAPKESVRRQLHAIDGGAAVSLRSLDEAIAWTRAPRVFTLRLLGFFSAAAILLALVGLYAITAQAVTAQTREIGIRLVLGAAPSRIMRRFVGHGTRLVFGGIAGGMVLAMLLSPLVARLLYNVPAFDAVTYGIVAAMLGGVGVVATWLPARRAMKIEPIVALRSE